MTCQRCHHPDAIERGGMTLCYACIDQIEEPKYTPELSEREMDIKENAR